MISYVQDISTNIYGRFVEIVRSLFSKISHSGRRSGNPLLSAGDALAHHGYKLYSEQFFRPGQRSKTILALALEKDFADEVWPMLKKILVSSAGNLETAMELAVKRINETFSLKQGMREWNSLAVAAVEENAFAVATGGTTSVYLITPEQVIDASVPPTPVQREKPLAAFASGLRHTAQLAVCMHASDDCRALLSPCIAVPQELLNVVPAFCISYQPTPTARPAAAALTKFFSLFSDRFKYFLLHPRMLWQTLQESATQTFRKFGGFIRDASPRNRIITAVVILCTLIAVRAYLTSVGAQTVDRIISLSLERQSRIEELITHDKPADALELIDLTLALLERAPRRLNETQAAALESVRERLLKSASVVTKLSIITNPVPVVSMEKSFREKRTLDLQGLALAQGKLYTVNKAEKEIYELDGTKRRIVVIGNIPTTAGDPVGIVPTPPGIVQILTERPAGILTLDPDARAFVFTPITLPDSSTIALAWAAYQDRLYLLDARTRSIYRYEETASGYNLWSPWASENSLDLSQATALTVDGSIYVAFQDRQIVRLVQGAATAFPIERIRPPLEQISTISTKEESPFLYLLDPPQRRVVVVSKSDGSLVAQYMSPQFTDLRGLYPDEAGRRIYLLNGDTIYSVGPDDKSLLK